MTSPALSDYIGNARRWPVDKKPVPRRLRIPVPVKLSKPLGLGDAVARVTKSVGIKPCSGCQRRAEFLNRLVEFEGRGGKRR